MYTRTKDVHSQNITFRDLSKGSIYYYHRIYCSLLMNQNAALWKKKKGKEKERKYIPVQLEEETFPWGFEDSQFGVSFIPLRIRYIIEEEDKLQNK